MVVGLRGQYFCYPVPDLPFHFPVEFDTGSHEGAGFEFDGVFAEYFNGTSFVLYLGVGLVAGNDDLSGLEVVADTVIKFHTFAGKNFANGGSLREIEARRFLTRLFPAAGQSLFRLVFKSVPRGLRVSSLDVFPFVESSVEEPFAVEVVTELVDGLFPDDDEYAPGNFPGEFVELAAEVRGQIV